MSSRSYLLKRRPDQRDTALWSPFSYHNRQLRSLIRSLVAESGTRSGSTVLDYGCADAPYKDDLPDGVSYVGADLEGNPVASVTLQPEGSLPLPDEEVDLVLSTQVLEHVEDPSQYLAECYRVLRPGGHLILTTHGIMYYHRDPVDHWRWTRTGLSKIVCASGFEVVRLKGLMGLVAAALQLIQDGTYYYVPRRLRPVYAFLMQCAIAFTDRRYSDEARIDNGLIIAALASKPSR